MKFGEVARRPNPLGSYLYAKKKLKDYHALVA
jgi:hypothetical protein